MTLPVPSAALLSLRMDGGAFGWRMPNPYTLSQAKAALHPCHSGLCLADARLYFANA